jgi:hypothetical protein
MLIEHGANTDGVDLNWMDEQENSENERSVSPEQESAMVRAAMAIGETIVNEDREDA